MCNETKNKVYAEAWEDYFNFVNSSVQKKLVFDDEVYIAFGAELDLPVEDLKFWYKDAERAYITSNDPADVVQAIYGFGLSEETIDELIDFEIGEGQLFENMGLWFQH